MMNRLQTLYERLSAGQGTPRGGGFWPFFGPLLGGGALRCLMASFVSDIFFSTPGDYPRPKPRHIKARSFSKAHFLHKNRISGYYQYDQTR